MSALYNNTLSIARARDVYFFNFVACFTEYFLSRIVTYRVAPKSKQTTKLSKEPVKHIKSYQRD